MGENEFRENEGDNDGRPEKEFGKTDGIVDGEALRALEGDAKGPRVETAVGRLLLLGISEGVNDGAAEGDAEVGVDDGCTDGSALRVAVGEMDGS